MNDHPPQGFELIDIGRGYMEAFGAVYLNRATRTLGFRVAARHLNPVNLCNGGAMATFADVQIVAVISGVGTAAGHAPTVSLSVDYLGGAPAGSWVEAPVTLLRQTRNMIFTQTVITADGEIVARSNGIYRHYGYHEKAASATAE